MALEPEHEPYDDIGAWLVAAALVFLVAALVLTGLGGLLVLIVTQSP